MPRAILIHPPTKSTVNRTEVAEIDGLEAMQKAVGGYIEAINFDDCTMFVNEEGIDLDLPVNPLASRFAKQRLTRIGRVLLTEDGWVLGTAIILGLVDANGDETDVPDHVVAELHQPNSASSRPANPENSSAT